jgi:integrase
MLAEALDPRTEIGKKESVPTLKDFTPRWLEEYAEAQRHKPSGIATARSILKTHLIPLLGSVPIDEIGAADAARLAAKLGDRSPKTVNNVLSALHGILVVAHRWGVIQEPPVRMPFLKHQKPEKEFWDFEDLELLVAMAAKTGWREHLIVLLGARAGLRRGEMAALTWGDVNLPRRRITVRRSLWEKRVTDTKGRTSRTVPLVQALADSLQAHRHVRGELVLCWDNGLPLTCRSIQTMVERVERAAGLRHLGVHALRHTFVSHLVMRGIPPKAIQELAGHSSLTTTMGYMHLSPGVLEVAIDALESGESWGEIMDRRKAQNVK